LDIMLCDKKDHPAYYHGRSDDVIQPDAVFSEVSGHTAEKDTDDDGDPDSHETDGQRYPGTLEHSCKDIPSQVIGAKEVDAHPGQLLRAKILLMGLTERRPQFLLKPDYGRIQDRVCPGRDNEPDEGDKEEQDKDCKAGKGELVTFQQIP